MKRNAHTNTAEGKKKPPSVADKTRKGNKEGRKGKKRKGEKEKRNEGKKRTKKGIKEL